MKKDHNNNDRLEKAIAMRKYNRQNVPPVMRRFLEDPDPYMMMKQFSPFSVTDLGFIWVKFMQVTQKYPNVTYLDRVSRNFQNVLIIGDTHGDFLSTLRIVKPFLEEKVDSLVFMGDYVDRGDFNFLNLMYLIGMVLAWPDRVMLLRGNHEDLEVNRIFGFFEELNMYFPDPNVFRTVQSIINAFYNLMSLVAITHQHSVCVHAGIPTKVSNFELLDHIPKPHDDALFLYDEKIIADIRDVYKQIRWNDPSDDNNIDELSRSYHGYYFYTEDNLNEFLKTNKFLRLYRSHEDPRGGYQEVFPGKLYHIFSTEPYFGKILQATVIHETPTKIILRDLDFNPLIILHPKPIEVLNPEIAAD